MTLRYTRPVTFAMLALQLTLVAGTVGAQPARLERQLIQRGQRQDAIVPPPAAPGSGTPDAQLDGQGARQTQMQLMFLLRQYPPSLANVLRLDPSLLTNQAYLAPYPSLAAFLAQHPDVAHNPGFFVGEYHDFSDQRSAVMRTWEDVLAGAALLIGFLSVLAVSAWVIRTGVNYRRWIRSSKVQAEVHTKLLDRFASNQDLLAFIQTRAGHSFLESARNPIELGSRAVSAPVGRILWSVQAGVIVALAALGLLYVSSHLTVANLDTTGITVPLYVLGILGLALGAGFALSALVAYVLSRRLGLFDLTVLGRSTESSGATAPDL